MIAGIFITFKILPNNQTTNPLLLIIILLSFFLLINFLLFKDKISIGRTEEGVVIGYYLLLAFALTLKKTVFIGIAIACCLLSRFSLFFWVPMYLAYVFFFESRKDCYVITAVIATILLFIFIIPYGISQPEYFINIPADYHVGVNNAWFYNYKDGGYYKDYLGYAKYFDISHIKLLHNLQIIVAAILPVVIISLYILAKNKISLNKNFFAICSLKLTLVFFYNMVEVPYYYLFFVSTFFSYTIVFRYLKNEKVVKPV